MRHAHSRSLLPLLLAAFAPASLARAQADDPTAARQKTLHAAGVAVPLTLYPVHVLGRPDANVADALGLVLERCGMSDLVVAQAAFDPGQAAWDAVPALLKAHVQANAKDGAAVRCGLFAQFLGDPRTGPTE